MKGRRQWRGTCEECGRRYPVTAEMGMTRHDDRAGGVCLGTRCDPMPGSVYKAGDDGTDLTGRSSVRADTSPTVGQRSSISG